MRKKIIRMIVLFALVFLCGCSQQSERPEETNRSETVTVWAWDPTYNIKALELAAEYSDIRLDIVEISQLDIVDKLNASFASESKEGLPDLVLISDYRIEQYLNSYPDVFMPLTDIIEEDQFVDHKINMVKKEDEIYAVPFECGVAGLFYRVDYLEAAGYKEQELENITWDTYLEIGKQVKEKTGKYMLAIDPNDQQLLRMMMISAGGWYTSKETGEIVLEENQPLKESMAMIAKMVDAGIVIETSGGPAEVETVHSGQVATAIRGSWYSSTIMKETSQSGKWRIAPFPRFSNIPSVNASDLGGSNWFVLKDGENADLAKQFLADTFASSETLLARLTEEIGLVSTMKTVFNTDIYQQPVAFYGDQTVYKDFFEWMQKIPETTYGNRTFEAEEIMIPYVSRAVMGEDIDSLLKEAQRQVEVIP